MSRRIGRYGRARAAFAFDVDERSTVVGGANVALVGLAELLSAQTCRQCGEDDREITFGSIGVAL